MNAHEVETACHRAGVRAMSWPAGGGVELVGACFRVGEGPDSGPWWVLGDYNGKPLAGAVRTPEGVYHAARSWAGYVPNVGELTRLAWHRRAIGLRFVP